VSLGVRRPSGTRDQFYFHLQIFFRQLRLCYFVVLSLTRGRVCNLLVQLLLGLARAVTHGNILLSHVRLPQPGGSGSRIYIPQEQGGPRTLGSLSVASYDSQGLRWKYSNPPPHWLLVNVHRGTSFIVFSFSVLHGVISQKIELFITTVARTSNTAPLSSYCEVLMKNNDTFIYIIKYCLAREEEECLLLVLSCLCMCFLKGMFKTTKQFVEEDFSGTESMN
jgi:hypothetical protein